MTITINGTTGIAGVDGSASVPAFKGNDADTGIYYPTANEVAAAAGGSAVWNAASTFAFKNRLINGNFDIWQRGTSFSLSGSAVYTADRWQVGGATGTVSRQAFTNGQTDVPGNPAFYAQWALTSNSQNYEFVQKVESVRTFAGQTVTASFYARRTAGSITIGPRLVQFFGTGGSPSATTVTSLGSMSLTSSWQKFTLTATLPSISGKTIGTSSDDSLWLSFQVADTNTGTIEFAEMQLEFGSVGTSFDDRFIGTELALCQRYYEKSYDSNIPPGTATSAGRVDMPSNTSGTTAYYVPTTVQFKVTKRTQGSVRFWDQAGNLSRVTDYSAGGLVRTDNRNSVWGVASGDTSFYLINTQNPASFSSFQWDASAEL